MAEERSVHPDDGMARNVPAGPPRNILILHLPKRQQQVHQQQQHTAHEPPQILRRRRHPSEVVLRLRRPPVARTGRTNGAAVPAADGSGRDDRAAGSVRERDPQRSQAQLLRGHRAGIVIIIIIILSLASRWLKRFLSENGMLVRGLFHGLMMGLFGFGHLL